MQELVDPQKMASKKPPDPIPRPRGGAAGASLSSTLLTDRPGSLQLKMDEMKEHITKLKKELETERMSSKRLKRDKMMELRNIRCEEQKKSAEALATFLNETSEFRSIKKKLEAELEHAVAANRKNGSELRRISEEHSRELDQLKKEARRDIIHV